MKKLFAIFAAAVLMGGGITSTVQAQCANDNVQWLSWSFTSVGQVNSTSCIYGGEYNLVNVVAGNVYRFSTCGNSAFDTQITLYNNAGGAALGYSDDFCGTQSEITWTATFTGQLRVLVDRYNCASQSTCMTLTGTLVSSNAPTVNPCNTVTGLSCGTTKNFSIAAGAGAWAPGGPFSTPGSEAVFSFTPTITGAHQIAVSHTGGGWIDLFVRTGACAGPTGWTYIDDILGSATNVVTLTAGVTYHFLLDDEDQVANSGTITVTCPSPTPPCALASSISCGQTVTGTTVGGSFTGGLPTCSGFSVGTGGQRWYKFTGTGQAVTASLCNAATTYDSKLHVFSGSCTTPVCVVADDDACLSPGLASEVSWCAAAGQTYYILVNGFGSAEGPYSLSITCGAIPVSINSVAPLCLGGSAFLSASPAGGTFSGPGVTGNTFSASAAGVGSHTITYNFCGSTATTTVTVLAPPSNDLCSGAISISAGNSYTGSTTCATVDAAGLTFCGTSGGTANGVWYSFVGDGNRWNIETCNTVSNYDTKLHVFTGANCSGFSCVAGNDDMGSSCTQTGGGTASFKSQVEFCTTIGQTYYVLVHGFSTATGIFQLDVTSTPGPSVNAGANAIVYTGWSGAPSCTDLTAVGSGGTAPYTYSWSNGATGATINVCPTTTTDYTVTVTDANGCQGTDVVRVCVVDLACGRDKIFICHFPPGNPNNSQTLCISPNGWLNGHSNNHAGDHIGPCGSNVCTDDNQINKAAAAVIEAELSAAPNPFKGNTTITFVNGADERVSVKVYNMLGAEIATLFDGMMAAGEQKSLTFAPNTAAAGVYMVKMSTASGKTIVKRVVME